MLSQKIPTVFSVPIAAPDSSWIANQRPTCSTLHSVPLMVTWLAHPASISSWVQKHAGMRSMMICRNMMNGRMRVNKGSNNSGLHQFFFDKFQAILTPENFVAHHHAGCTKYTSFNSTIGAANELLPDCITFCPRHKLITVHT